MRTLVLLAVMVLGLGAVLLSTPRPAAASHVAAISGGGMHTCVLTLAGGVECWGRNDSGQLGNGTKTDSPRLSGVVGLESGVAAVSAGAIHTCAVTTEGTVKCWGAVFLGDGETIDSAIPIDVMVDSDVVDVAAGAWYTCALTRAGGVMCWGTNIYGQLGDGTTTTRPTPVDALEEPGGEPLSGVVAVSAGDDHACALTSEGGVKCWGKNDFGQLGASSGDACYLDVPCSTTPLDVTGLTSGVAEVSGGAAHTCALTLAGGVKCWGFNQVGQLGDGTTTDRHTPVDVLDEPGGQALAGAAGVSAQHAVHTCALSTGGGVKCWGFNFYGQTGDVDRCGSTHPYSCLTPVDVPGLGSNVAAVTTGAFHTCVLTTGGDVSCRGDDWFHQLGDTDGDGYVNSADATLILQLHARLVASLADEEAADVNQDNAVNSVDAEVVLQYDAGLIANLRP